MLIIPTIYQQYLVMLKGYNLKLHIILIKNIDRGLVWVLKVQVFLFKVKLKIKQVNSHNVLVKRQHFNLISIKIPN